MKFFTAIITALAIAVSTTTATPVDARSELIVVNPPITSPAAGNIWPVGSQQLVQWDTSNIPPEADGYTGSIVLGYDDGQDESENLNYRKLTPRPFPYRSSPYLCMRPPHAENPLADGFLLTDGSAWITIPDVPDGSSYFVVRKSPSCVLGSMPSTLTM